MRGGVASTPGFGFRHVYIKLYDITSFVYEACCIVVHKISQRDEKEKTKSRVHNYGNVVQTKKEKKDETKKRNTRTESLRA